MILGITMVIFGRLGVETNDSTATTRISPNPSVLLKSLQGKSVLLHQSFIGHPRLNVPD